MLLLGEERFDLFGCEDECVGHGGCCAIAAASSVQAVSQVAAACCIAIVPAAWKKVPAPMPRSERAVIGATGR